MHKKKVSMLVKNTVFALTLFVEAICATALKATGATLISATAAQILMSACWMTTLVLKYASTLLEVTTAPVRRDTLEMAEKMVVAASALSHSFLWSSCLSVWQSVFCRCSLDRLGYSLP